MKISQALQGHKLFSAMSLEQMEKILTCANPRVEHFAAKHMIIDQGEELTAILLVLAGELNLFKTDYQGNRSLVGTITHHDVYGQMAVFGDNAENTLIVEAATDCTILFLKKSLFYQTCSNTCPAHQLLIKNMMTLLVAQTAVLERKIGYLTAKTLRAKISRFLLAEYHRNGDNKIFVIGLNREELAEYLDVQRPSLSRELMKLKKEGIIDFYKFSFKLLMVDKLEGYAR